MDSDELTRAIVGLPVAAVVPRFVPGLTGWRARAVVAALIGVWALGPALDEWEAWVLLAGVVAASILLSSKMLDGPRALGSAALVGLILASASAALLDWTQSVEALDAGAAADDAVVITAGVLTAIFVGGAAIERLLQPFAANVAPAASADLHRAGLLIGWLERALLYGFVVAGAASGVALVVAAKSLARLPSLSKEDRFAEYFLIGTLASVLVAVGLGVAARAILGLDPLLS